MTTDSTIHLRVPAEQKARWVRESRAAGMRLTDWIVARVDGQKGKTMIQYTIRPSVLTVDTRAAADACNRELMEAGDTADLRAVEQKIAECHPALRDALRIESQEWDEWEAWEDGSTERETFRVLQDGQPVDIAEAAARALGVEVSERLNMRRVQ